MNTISREEFWDRLDSMGDHRILEDDFERVVIEFYPSEEEIEDDDGLKAILEAHSDLQCFTEANTNDEYTLKQLQEGAKTSLRMLEKQFPFLVERA